MDETDKAETYRKLAREAREMDNGQKAKEYYNQLVTLCPDDWEAFFFSVYYTAASCVIAQISVAAANVSSAVQLVVAKTRALPYQERFDICNEVITYTLVLKEAFLKSARKHQMTYGTTDSYNEFCERKEAIFQMAKAAADAAVSCGYKDRAINIYENLIGEYEKKRITKLIEALEPGRGVKMMAPNMEALKATQQKNRKMTKIVLAVFGVGVIITILGNVLGLPEDTLLPISMVLTLGGAFMSLMSIPINASTNKKIKKLESEIEQLKK
jgi:tetratricopeptide (TPR) repeat protein